MSDNEDVFEEDLDLGAEETSPGEEGPADQPVLGGGQDVPAGGEPLTMLTDEEPDLPAPSSDGEEGD